MNDSIYAGLWKRFLATIIDVILFIPIYYLVEILISNFLSSSTTPSLFPLFDLFFNILVSLLPTIVIFMIQIHFLVSKWQATPGKRIMSIFVGHKGDGIKISKLSAFFRVLLRGIVLSIFPIGIGFLMIDFIPFFRISEFINYTITGLCLISPALLSLILVISTKSKLTIYDLICSSRVYNGRT